MQHRQRTLEFLLRLWRTRGLEQYSAELLASRPTLRGGIVLVGKHASDTDVGKETYGKYQGFRFHNTPLMVVDRTLFCCLARIWPGVRHKAVPIRHSAFG